ncbi:hypothetical protein [Streptomyces anulatus]|uniref:hypothetical protein n=1 Tax=Streptomyces anulatus TaxID=1892 RepID=UPI0036D1ABD3
MKKLSLRTRVLTTAVAGTALAATANAATPAATPAVVLRVGDVLQPGGLVPCAQWRDLPEQLGPQESVHGTNACDRADGTVQAPPPARM